MQPMQGQYEPAHRVPSNQRKTLDMKGLIPYELLEPKQTINDVRFSQKLRRLNEKILEKRSGPDHKTVKSYCCTTMLGPILL